MPGYIDRALQRFNHDQPTKAEHAPHKWVVPTYGAKIQYTEATDETAPLPPDGTKRVQEIVGVLLYYARAIDCTMLVALNDIATTQSSPTERTLQACTKLLNYAATHPDATIRYVKSDMILHVHSDASYLSAPKARSRLAGFIFLANTPKPDHTTHKNGPIHVATGILKHVMASAAEAETGSAFHNAQTCCPLRVTLEFLHHRQPATPIIVDNACAEGIVNDTIKQKRSKAMDMRFYWLRDRKEQGQFTVHWRPGECNLADYFSKHHSPAHHIVKRPTYLHIKTPTSQIGRTEQTTPAPAGAPLNL